MIKKLRYLCTLLLIAVASAAWGQSDYSAKEETGEDVTLTAGTNGSACTVNGYDGIKVGTSKLGGDMTITVPAGTTHLHLHAVAWKGVTGLSLNITGATTSPSSISLTADDGISNNSPFTLNGSASDFYFVVALSNITAETTLTLTSSSAKRFVVWGVNAEKVTGPLPPSIVANNVDIAYNATLGSIEYSINNKVDDGELTASTDANWLTLGTVGETIPFTCPANDDGAARSADVTLTYTYNTSETVTNTITITQAGNPNGPGSLSNPYTVAQARAAIDEGIGTTGVYATGIVSAIPTAYDEGYKNITFNFVDESGALEFLQAYRCIGDEAENVQVGDIVVVYGDLTKYNSTYEFAQGCKLISLTHPIVAVKAPTFNPSDGATFEETMEVELNQEDGKPIYYNINSDDDPTSNSTLYEEPFTINATSTIKAIAKDGEQYSSVATATYTKLAIGNISEITEVGTLYKVRGTVVATNNKGLVIGDGTGYVYYYKNGAVSQSIGDKVTISGTTGTYGHIIQFTNTATITEASTSNYNNGPAATVITEVPDYSQGYHLSTYLEFEGTLNKSNSSYYIAVGEGQIQISYPTTEQGTALTALADKTVHVKGYFAGINSSDKFTVMLESVEEVAGIDPVINAENVTLAYDATSGEIAYTIENSVDGTSLTAALKESAEWISGIAVTSEKVTFTTTANEGNADRTATITLTYGSVTKDITVTQGHYTTPSTEGTITFGSSDGSTQINSTSVTGSDSMGNTWTVTTTFGGEESFTQHEDCSQVGASKKPASSITFTTTLLSEITITIFEAKLGGYNDTAGDIILKVGDTEVGSGSLNGTEDVTVSNTQVATGTVLTVTVTNIAKGVKCYSISYSTNTDPYIEATVGEVLAHNATSGTVSYEVGNPVDGGVVTAATSAQWISNFVVGESTVTFDVTENTTGEDREGIITLTYTYDADKTATTDVTVSQHAAPYTLTVSDLSDVNLIVFSGDESESIINTENEESSAQVYSGTNVKISIDVETGYVLESLIVDGTDVTSQIDQTTGMYVFTMPSHNVAITATAILPFGDNYELFTGDLVEGDYIIYYEGKAMKNTVSNNRLDYVAVTPKDDVITTDNTAIVWHIAKSGDYWFIFNAAEGKFAVATGTKNQATLSETFDDKALWTVSGNETYEFVNKANAAAEVNANLRNNGTYGFACYATATGGALTLYKKAVSTKKGDLNNDGHVDVADVTALVNALKEGEKPEEGDIDGDEDLDADDVRALVEKVLSEE